MRVLVFIRVILKHFKNYKENFKNSRKLSSLSVIVFKFILDGVIKFNRFDDLLHIIGMDITSPRASSIIAGDGI